MAGEHYRHILLSGPSRTQGYTNPRRGSSDDRIPNNRDRDLHSSYLQERLRQTWSEVDRQRAVIQVERHGAYLEFESEPGFDLAIQSLENLRAGIRLLNIRREGNELSQRTLATVYVPNRQRGYFLKKIEAYAQEHGPGNKPKNAKLVDSISDIRRAVLKSFWRSDENDLIPGDDPEWVEVWLQGDKADLLIRFEALLRELNIELSDGVLKFPELSVLLIRANRSQLVHLVESSDDISEYRAAKQIAAFFIALQNHEQVERVRELLSRTDFRDDAGVSICILDMGVNNGHLLIQPVLNDSDLQAVDPSWGVHDNKGHGTLMAGTATYGDLLALLNSHNPVHVVHRLESVKILPPPPAENQKRLWGHMTLQGISRAEIQAPERKRIVCLAITSTEDRDRGRPSSWSAMVDELASGYEDDIHRLIVLSAGNVDDPNNWRNYPTDNLTNQVHDPGQAWNALTVGAFTEKTRIADMTLSEFTPLAPAGGLSPFSTTSSTWSPRKWPIKPEVVFEGGNVARGPNDSMYDPEDLKLLSTSHEPHVEQFAPFHATSAAAGQAAWMASQIQAQYPSFWPETVRALIMHTAEWTDAMKAQFIATSAATKQDYARLLRICGYGVPNLERALYCAANSLTLISETDMQPFDKVDSRYVTKDMHLYNLPWPSEVLSELGETLVKMRITLSYFVEPGPGEIGWDNRYRYASHALRFEVNGPGESEEEFVQRVNTQARDDEGEHPGTEGPRDKWIIGEARNVGSIHSDIWQGTAADLSTSNLIAVYPAVGWWRERHHLKRWDKRCRYSLIVSINTPDQTVDIYTPVAIQVGVTTTIPVRARRT